MCAKLETKRCQIQPITKSDWRRWRTRVISSRKYQMSQTFFLWNAMDVKMQESIPNQTLRSRKGQPQKECHSQLFWMVYPCRKLLSQITFLQMIHILLLTCHLFLQKRISKAYPVHLVIHCLSLGMDNTAACSLLIYLLTSVTIFLLYLLTKIRYEGPWRLYYHKKESSNSPNLH